MQITLKSAFLAVLAVAALSSSTDARSPGGGRRGLRSSARRAKQADVHQRAAAVAAAGDAATSAPLLAKRLSGSGRGTFYDPSVGPGACGKTFQKSDPIVAVNSAQFSQADCFKWITVSANGKTARAQITDECPTCSYGQMDFSPAVFDVFATVDEGIFQMSWVLGGSSDDDDTTSSSSTRKTTHTTPSSTSTYSRPTSTYTPSTSSTPRPTRTSTSHSSTSTSYSSSSSRSTSSSSSSSSSYSASSTSSTAASTPTASETAQEKTDNLGMLSQAMSGLVAMAKGHMS